MFIHGALIRRRTSQPCVLSFAALGGTRVRSVRACYLCRFNPARSTRRGGCFTCFRERSLSHSRDYITYEQKWWNRSANVRVYCSYRKWDSADSNFCSRNQGRSLPNKSSVHGKCSWIMGVKCSSLPTFRLCGKYEHVYMVWVIVLSRPLIPASAMLE